MPYAKLFYGFKIHQTDISNVDNLESELIIKYPNGNAINCKLKELDLLKSNLEDCKRDEDFRKRREEIDRLVFGCRLTEVTCGIYNDIIYYLIIKDSYISSSHTYYGSNEKTFDELPITNPNWQKQLDDCCNVLEIPKQKASWIFVLSNNN